MSAAAELGPRLRAERERRGLGVQKAADELRLDAWVIEALEMGQYERIGAAVYAKGHLKKYAALLGLPADEIVAEYESLNPRPAQPATVAPEATPRALFSSAQALPWRKFAVPVLLLVVIAGVLWRKPWRETGGHPPAVQPAVRPAMQPVPDTPAAEPATRAAAPPTPAAAGRAPALAGGERTVAPPAPAGAVQLRLTFSADSWIDVHDAAGRRLYRGMRRADTSLTLAGGAPLSVILGFAGGVRVEINGRAAQIGPALVSGNVARFSVGADGVPRRQSARTRPQD